MATIALPAVQPLLPVFKSPFTRTLLAAASLPTFQVAPKQFGWSLHSAWESLIELIPPILLAVPKKKTSHSRKSMRSANKGLKDKQSMCGPSVLSASFTMTCIDLVLCPGCGSPKLAHHLCPNCYSRINREWKAKSKGAGGFFSGVPEVTAD